MVRQSLSSNSKHKMKKFKANDKTESLLHCHRLRIIDVESKCRGYQSWNRKKIGLNTEDLEKQEIGVAQRDIKLFNK